MINTKGFSSTNRILAELESWPLWPFRGLKTKGLLLLLSQFVIAIERRAAALATKLLVGTIWALIWWMMKDRLLRLITTNKKKIWLEKFIIERGYRSFSNIVHIAATCCTIECVLVDLHIMQIDWCLPRDNRANPNVRRLYDYVPNISNVSFKIVNYILIYFHRIELESNLSLKWIQ